MTMYDDVRAKVEQLGGSVGPAGVGSINLNGGTEIKIRYDVPGPGVRIVSIVPYLIGSDETPSPSPPPVDHQTLLAWQYTPDPGYPGAAGLEVFQDWTDQRHNEQSGTASVTGKFASVGPGAAI